MDQNRVGKFIAECRKEKGLTQAQVAEQFGISNKAVSKWETGKSLPDASIMIDLCNLLGITVNELLSGERISKDDYKEKAEANLVEMQDKKENTRKTMLASIVSLVILCVEFIAIRYPLFGIHRTAQYPLILLVLCLLVIMGSFIAKAIVTPLVTSVSYAAGYFLAELLKTNSIDANGGATDNMWVIWTVILVAVAVFSGIVEFMEELRVKKAWIVRALLISISCVPFAFLSVNGDAASRTMAFYGLMIIGFAVLCFGALKINNIPIIYIGNALSFASSYIVAKTSGLEPMGYYFKPFTAYSLIVAISIAAVICQTIPVLIHTARKKRSNSI